MMGQGVEKESRKQKLLYRNTFNKWTLYNRTIICKKNKHYATNIIMRNIIKRVNEILWYRLDQK